MYRIRKCNRSFGWTTYLKLHDMAYNDPEALHTAPHKAPVRRLDEVGAARNMVLRYKFS